MTNEGRRYVAAWAALVWAVAVAAGLWLAVPWPWGDLLPALALLGGWGAFALLLPHSGTLVSRHHGAHTDRAGLASLPSEPGPAGSMILHEELAYYERAGIIPGLPVYESDLEELPDWAAPEADRYGGYGMNSGSMGSDYHAAPTIPAGAGGDSAAVLPHPPGGDHEPPQVSPQPPAPAVPDWLEATAVLPPATYDVLLFMQRQDAAVRDYLAGFADWADRYLRELAVAL